MTASTTIQTLPESAELSVIMPEPRVAFEYVHDLRQLTLPPIVDTVQDLIAVGANVIWSEPGLGKTFLANVIEEHLGHGTPMGQWGTPDTPGRVLVMDGESNRNMIQDRSYAITPELATDTGADWTGAGGIRFFTDPASGRAFMPGRNGHERNFLLLAELQKAEDEGHPISYVRLDTLDLYCGDPVTRGKSKGDHQGDLMVELNGIGERFGCAIVLLHHSRRDGEYSGATRIKGGVNNFIGMKRNPDQEHEILLTSEKTRGGAPFKYVLMQDPTGKPRFVEDAGITPSQAEHIGCKRAILDHLHANGPATPAEIVFGLRRFAYTPTLIRKSIQRLYHTDYAINRQRHQYVIEQGHQITKPEPLPACTVCHAQLHPQVAALGDSTCPACEPEPAPPAVDHPADEAPAWNAYKALGEAIASAKKVFPRPVLPKAERGQAPWTYVHEKMDGQHHRWMFGGELPADCRVAVIDRRGSYPSVLGSVYVAPNVLQHTGPLDQRGDRAGLFLIDPIPWDDTRIGHPLGWTAGDGIERIWITTPHLLHLTKLARKGVIDWPVIRDSWTGKGMSNLFERFGREVAEQRDGARENSPEAYNAVKLASSSAIRALWPKQEDRVNSPFWRPDWHQSIEAEASVRHWAKAYAAVLTGETLIRLGNTDAATFVAPADADDTWTPFGYTIGESYGQVSHAKVKVAGIDIPSPVTLQQWNGRGRRA